MHKPFRIIIVLLLASLMFQGAVQAQDVPLEPAAPTPLSTYFGLDNMLLLGGTNGHCRRAIINPDTLQPLTLLSSGTASPGRRCRR